MLQGDRSATGRADKFDLTAGIDLSNPHDMRAPAAGAGDFISVAGHKIESQATDIRSSNPFCGARRLTASPFYFSASVLDTARLWTLRGSGIRPGLEANGVLMMSAPSTVSPIASEFGLFAGAEPARRLGVSARGIARWAALGTGLGR